MLHQGKRAMDSFVRVQAFLDAHPVTGRLSYADAHKTLDEAGGSWCVGPDRP